MSAVFTPPSVAATPQFLDPAWAAEPTRGPALRLMRYFTPGLESQPVFRLTSGAYTTAQPFPTTSDTIAWVYWGAHVYRVNDVEAAALVAAGFTVTDSVPGDGLGGVGDTFDGQGPIGAPPPSPGGGGGGGGGGDDESGYGEGTYGAGPYGS